MNSERHIKATRKEHQCLGCLRDIPRGSSCLYVAQVYQGEFNAFRLCKLCEDVWKDIHLDDSWSPGDLANEHPKEVSAS